MALPAGVLVLLLIATSTALAQTTDAPAEETEARGLFLAGRVAYEDGRFEEALERFEAALESSRRPELLFNVGLAAQRAGHADRAVEAYEAYLAALPDAPNRPDVEARLRETREMAALRSSAGGGPGPVPWILVGGGAAVAIAGVVLLVLAQADIATVENAEEGSAWGDVEAAHDRAPALSTGGAILAVVGAASATVGVVWLLTTGGSESAQVSFGPGSITLRGRF